MNNKLKELIQPYWVEEQQGVYIPLIDKVLLKNNVPEMPYGDYMEYAKSKGIQIFNAPGLNANAVAELTISKMLDISRGTFTANYDVKVKHEWDKYKFEGRELRGKTLGIMGFGRIGQRVGELGRAFKMDIVAYDPFLPDEVFEQQCAKKASIEELIQVADYISIHVPLTPETKNLFNKESIAKMKDGAVVLNMSRGGICNEGETLLAPVRTYVDNEQYAMNAKLKTKICRAELGNDAGIIGAALLGE